MLKQNILLITRLTQYRSRCKEAMRRWRAETSVTPIPREQKKGVYISHQLIMASLNWEMGEGTISYLTALYEVERDT